MRVGIPESVPPPRLVIGFGKDRRTVDAVRVQDETVVYRYWLTVAAGRQHGPRRAGAGPGREGRIVVKPKEVADNVSGDKRYGNETGLHVDSMVVRGPGRLSVRTSFPSRIGRSCFARPTFGDQSRLDCARAVIARFAERAFRRPVSARGSRTGPRRSFDWPTIGARASSARIQLALTTVLASPQFLFLVEPEEAREDRPLTEFELASRLSYFLWSSMPDDELFREARAGTLRAESPPPGGPDAR